MTRNGTTQIESGWCRTEAEMVEHAVAGMARLYCREVPALGRSCDLAFLDEEGLVTAIEFKRRDWRRAVEQAWTYKLVADYAWVCLLARTNYQGLEGECLRRGIALTFWRPKLVWPYDVKIPAIRSDETWSPGRDAVAEYIQRHAGVGE
jgi:hypothetical protein